MLTRIVIIVFAFVAIPAVLLGSVDSQWKWLELSKTADSLHKIKDLDSAIAVGRTALRMAELALPPEDTALANIMFMLGVYLFEDKSYGESGVYLNQALSIREKVFGVEHPVVASTIFELARLHNLLGNHSLAEQLLRQSLAIRQRILQPGDIAIAESYQYLALVCRNQNKLYDAEENYRKAIETCIKANEKGDTLRAFGLGELGVTLRRQGRIKETREATMESLKINLRLHGPENIYVARCFSNLGSLNAEMGDYSAAEDYYRRSIMIKNKCVGPKHPDVALTLWSLGDLYCYLNNYARAEELLSQALDIYIETFTENHIAPAQLINALGVLYRKMGNYEKAEEHLLRSYDITARLFGEEHANLIHCLIDLSLIYRDCGKYTGADTLLEKALAICHRMFPPQHPMVADILNKLAIIDLKKGNPDRAKILVDSALIMNLDLYGEKHEKIAECDETYSNYFDYLGDMDSAYFYAGRACLIQMSNFNDNAFCMSENDALVFSKSYKHYRDKLLSCYFRKDDISDSTTRSILDIILSSKGHVSDRIFERQRSIAEEGDTTINNIVRMLKTAKFSLSRLYIDGMNRNPGGYKENMDSLLSLTDSLDGELSRRSVSYRRHKDYLDISEKRLAQKMPDDAAMIEYLEYNRSRPGSIDIEPCYLAAIIRKGRNPVIIDLGRAHIIDSIVDEYRQHMFDVSLQVGQLIQSNMDSYRTICAALNKSIWNPISDYIGNSELLLIAPDGELNNISFAGLLIDNNHYLAERYVVHYLSAGRDIFRYNEQPMTGTGLFAIGDPDYDAPVFMRIPGRTAVPVQETTSFEYKDRS
ncbi:MAG: tetratricopeptide repeat protein, partial [Candidatus Zixiibacteriota bacterium]